MPLPYHRLLVPVALWAGLSACADLSLPDAEPAPDEARLVGYARLPAASYVPGPVSGQRLGRGVLNGVTLPFVQGQPVQGLSALVPDGGGFYALSDNGYGNRKNSVDAELRIYRLDIAFRRAGTPRGRVRIERTLSLRDPDRQVPFPLQQDASRERILTGADFDPEALVRAGDGSFWLGEEFGPFLLHVSGDGRVLEAPIALPDPDHPGAELRGPDHPAGRTRPGAPGARVRRSGGIEGLAAFPDGRHLLVALEKPLTDAAVRELLWLEFDTQARAWTGRHWRYALSPETEGVGELVLAEADRGYALESAGPTGKGPRLLRRFRLLAGGRISAETVVDLSRLADPERLGPAWPGTPPGRIDLPFTALESLALVDGGERLIVGNDNNFPYGIVRQRARRRPDDSEFYLIALPDAE